MKQSRDHPQSYRRLNQVIVYLWSKFCDRLMSYHVDKPKVHNSVKSDFEVKFDIQGQGQSYHKTMGTLTKVFAPLVQIW